MVKEVSWDFLRDSGLLTVINQFLHIFGIAIVVEIDDSQKVIRAYPSRVKFRGFTEKSTETAYKKISAYMVDNAEELYNEVLEN